MNLLEFQLARLDNRLCGEWLNILQEEADALEYYGVSPEVLTEWAILETCLGKTAIHFNYFNVDLGPDFPHNYYTVNEPTTIAKGAQAPSRVRKSRFNSPNEAIRRVCAMLKTVQTSMLGVPKLPSNKRSINAITSKRELGASVTTISKDLANTLADFTIEDKKGNKFAKDAAGNIIQLISTTSGNKYVVVAKDKMDPDVLARLEAAYNNENNMVMYLGVGALAAFAIALVALNTRRK